MSKRLKEMKDWEFLLHSSAFLLPGPSHLRFVHPDRELVLVINILLEALRRSHERDLRIIRQINAIGRDSKKPLPLR